MCRISDYTGNTKFVFVIGTCCECIGSFMYFMGISKWFIVSSRFVAGTYCVHSLAIVHIPDPDRELTSVMVL